ncbi:VWA domain containing CoxE-like protein [Saccharothrix carnea]|uniref:VWA domain containing CoxE-like protein n=2 Tax=Saccharothrix carnea TaxID=1280637 RepID=A0A2P8HZT6_SACCR|nr:VWA domain containing CoxE-like protein [Saccharothrix carnea]
MRDLADHRHPYLIGVRHHSPALAAVVPALLDAFAPEVLLVELPEELGEWLPFLADPDLVAPVALSGASPGGDLAFYPFADFSPELAAVRWARANGVEVRPCDLPLALRGDGHRPAERGPTPLTDALRGATTGRDGDDLWDRLVEAAAPGQTPEAVRRAALMVGWAFRQDADVDPYDLRREAWMRRAVREVGGRRCAAVVGSFHAAALLEGPVDDSPVPAADIVTSLVPYGFALLDERSGYPAGIRDPEWQQAVLEAAGDPDAVEAAAASVVVRICARVRELGHPAGPGEAREALRLAVDLARLRGLPAPGRGELVEAVQSVLTHAEPLGRGRVVARAAGDVLVGHRTGVLAPGTPRSGLAPAVESQVAALKLPGPDSREPVSLRLDPLRSALDARREVALRRLAVLGVTYGEETATTGVGGADALTTRWTVAWTPATAATLPVAGLWGATLDLAAAGRLRARRAERDQRGGHTPGAVLADLRDSALCGLPDVVDALLSDAATVLPTSATLRELLAGLDLLDRLRAGHVPGTSGDVLDGHPSLARELETAAVAQLDGLAGSEDVADARALVELGQRPEVHGLRLEACLRTLADTGAPLIAGAAGAARVLLGLVPPAALGERVASWVDGASTPERRGVLRRGLTGVLAAAGPLLETPEALTPLLDRVEGLADRDFLERLPALRGAFTSVGPAARARVLAVVEERTGERVDAVGAPDPELLAVWLEAEHAAVDALRAHGLLPHRSMASADAGGLSVGADGGNGLPATGQGVSLAEAAAEGGLPAEAAGGSGLSATGDDGGPAEVTGGLPVAVRWRLVLGAHGDRPAGAGRFAAALDELYGRDGGEGAARGDLGADRSSSFPGVREWSEELRDLFGERVREEVLAAAAEGGRLEAALEIDPGSVRPSVDLLRNVLSLAGGLSESALARLRPLVARLVRELTDQLANRVKPALTGIQLPTPTRRPGGRLDLPRTLRANLATARRGADGRVVVVPERPVFRTRGRKANDWRLVLVVDVSGSMESSTVWAALTASVFAGVSALSTHFLAFSTEVVDLSDRVADPLSLLLEVRVGGGTHIAGALRHARSLVTVPERTMVVLVSDFEEGGPVGPLVGQVRELVTSGVTVLGCASLDDRGVARYSTSVAGALVAAGMPVAALSPQELARWVGEKVRG